MLETNLGLLKKATEVKLVETTNALPDTVAKQFPEDSLHLTHPEIELRFIAIFQRYIHISDNGSLTSSLRFLRDMKRPYRMSSTNISLL